MSHWLLLRGLSREKRHFGEFPAVFERLVPGHRTFTLDLAGFGTESERDSPTSIDEIVDDVRTRFLATRPSEGPWSIFAISLGGMVALNWAGRFPDEWQRVVVANTSAADLSKPWERFAPAMWPKLPALVFGNPLSRERSIIDVTINGSLDREALAREWTQLFEDRRPTRRSFVRQIYAASRSAVPSTIKPPVLVLASRADRLVSWHCSERIAKKLGAPLEVHDAAGHDLSADAPAWICERIRAHS